MPVSPDIAFVDRYRPLIVRDMHAALDAATAHDPMLPLYTMIRYHLGWSDRHGQPVEAAAGKLLRPSLVLLCAEALGGDPERALPAASAVEFVHNFSLIHDDIEDRGELRHGRAAVWKEWGLPLAVNAGDGLWALARASLYRLQDAGVGPDRAIAAMRVLDEACVALCEGQDRDIRFEGDTSVREDDYLRMVRGKTGALMAACAAIGGILAGADEPAVRALHSYGLRLGEAFQARDDALGVWGDGYRTGKATGEDIRERKLSYPVVYALSHSDDAARVELERLYGSPIDDTAVEAVLVLLDRAGAAEATGRLATAAAGEAVQILDTLPVGQQHRDELAGLASFAATRSS